MSNKHGHFHWNELISHDPEAARAFYAKAIGWTFDEMDMGSMTYWVANEGGQPVAGVMGFTDDMPKEMPSHWMSYLAVDDIDKRVAEAEAAGATIVTKPFDVPNVGRIAMLKDPSGGFIGWMTPADA
ncbi:MAG: VOC family protein [Pseudomonadota bacterium]